MAGVTYEPVNGPGGNINIGSYDLPMYMWQIVTSTENSSLYSGASYPFCDEFPEWTRSVIVATGYHQKTFNPQDNAKRIQNGTFKTCVLTAFDGRVYSFPSVLIVNWTFGHDVRSGGTWGLTAVSNGKFTDWGGGNAA